MIELALIGCLLLPGSAVQQGNANLSALNSKTCAELVGLKSVSLDVGVDSAIPKYEDVENRIRESAANLLKNAGVSVDSDQPPVFAIEVSLWEINKPEFAGLEIVEVSASLIEETRLLRKSAFKGPVNAETWRLGASGLVDRADISAYVLRKSVEIVGYFQAAVKAVNNRR